MEYEVFKEAVLENLEEICDSDVRIKTEKVLKNNGKHYDVVRLVMDGEDENVCPAIPLQWFYSAYCDGEISIAGCVKVIYETSEEEREKDGISGILRKIKNWGEAKESVYPILLSTADNQEMLEGIVSVPMLDLSVAYIFRGKIDKRWAGVKISYRMLEAYGISPEELHKQALKNLADDGYFFWDIHDFAASVGYYVPDQSDRKEMGDVLEAYILTNAMNYYGAAGILDRKRVREFAAGRNFIILPTSINETIFVLAEEGSDIEIYNCMVKTVNRTDLDIEDWLSDHAYFYDGTADEIRMCA